jgi:hypothetical protein
MLKLHTFWLYNFVQLQEKKGVKNSSKNPSQKTYIKTHTHTHMHLVTNQFDKSKELIFKKKLKIECYIKRKSKA